MNRPYQPSSQRARTAFAVIAVLISVTIGSLIDSLAEHDQGAVLAVAPASTARA